MPETTTRLFVYGTLMPGGHYYPSLARHVRRRWPGTIRGMLVNVGWYPALLPGDGLVRGLVYELPDSALRTTDAIEQYDARRGAGEYLRKRVTVEIDPVVAAAGANSLEAWTYEYARPERLAHLPKLFAGRREGVPVYAWRNEHAPPAGRRP